MKVFKGCALTLLSFILFLSLFLFGFAYTVNQVALNPGVVNGIIRDTDFSEIARMTFEDENSPQTPETLETQQAIIDTIDSIQPVLKEKLYIAVKDSYAYLNGKSSVPNLKVVLGDSFMNRDFVEKLLAKINLTDLVEQTLSAQSNGGGDAGQMLQEALLATIRKIEPDFKTQVTAASDPVFQYLLGETNSIDLKTTARNTFLSNGFITTVIDNIDLKSLLSDVLRDQFALPESIVMTDNQLDRIATILEPVVKSNLSTAAGPVADYIVGKSSNFTVNITFQSVLPQFKPIVTEAFIASMPPELEGLITQAEIDAAVDVYWDDAVAALPVNIVLNSTDFGEGMDTGTSQMFDDLQQSLDDIRDSVQEGTQEVEANLADARAYIGYFRIAYYCLIGLILLFIGGIILIHRSIKGASQSLGITFTVYGTLMFINMLVVRAMVPFFIRFAVERGRDLPQFATDMMPNLVRHGTSPLFTFGLVCLILGIVLIVVSVVYPKMKARKEAPFPVAPTGTS